MNKTKIFCTWQILLVFMLTGCGISTFKATPTALPPHTHYTPSKLSNVHLEFDYPNSWTFSEEIQNSDFMVLGLGDPRFHNLPTPPVGELHPMPTDFGSITIWIVPSTLRQTAETELESLKQTYNEISWMTVLDDYEITIDGYDAGVLEYQTEDPEGPLSLMFNRRIFFIVGDQFYEILFTIAEKDRGGEFEQGYEYFFNSLKIVP